MPHILWRKVLPMSLEFIVNYVLDWFRCMTTPWRRYAASALGISKMNEMKNVKVSSAETHMKTLLRS